MKDEKHRLYLEDLGKLIGEFALESKKKHDETKNLPSEAFNTGYLSAFHRVISLMQQQADAFGISYEEIGLAQIDADRDLI